MDLVAAAENAASVRAFIEGAEFQEMLAAIGGVELDAARDALKKRKHARDPRQQVWSAVNHLETAHVAFRRGCQSKTRKYLAGTRWSRACDLDVITLCLMALCYRYLGEAELMHRAISDAWKAYNIQHDAHPATIFVQVASTFVNPVTYAVDMYFTKELPHLNLYKFTEQMKKARPQ